MSESRKRAINKYRREKTKTVSLRLFPRDADIAEHLDGMKNKAQYLRDLIRTDMTK